MAEEYRILRVMNNNVILVGRKPKGTQLFLIGKGLGFKRKPGMEVTLNSAQIEKSFLAYDTKEKNDYLTLIENLDDKLIGLCSEITLMAEKRMGKLNENLLIVLTDHIGFAIERIKKGLAIQNPFVYEIKNLYPEEFEIGLEARTLIKEQLGVEINEDEVAFIALHLDAAKLNTKASDSLNKTRIVKLMVSFLEETLGVKLEKNLTYIRLITHFRSSLDRAEKNISVENPLLPTVKKSMKKSYALAKQAGELVQRESGFVLPEGELGYLAIHIDRIRRILKKR
ncbi:PRD domain-containing protein [Caproicibacter sp.]|uniref:PRD domain-containing protein n=1 Tax=Caproicibacter sp. TaxID=2814884 RepID=UPI003989C307